MENADIAKIFYDMADLMEIAGENPFRVRSFRNAALTIENLAENVASLLERGELQHVPGVGEGIVRRIREILETGTLKELQELEQRVPPGLLEVMRIEGVGPKTAKLLHDRLGVDDVSDLEQVAKAGKIRELHGMGPTREEKILRGLQRLKESAGRFRINVALQTADAIVARLKKLKEVGQIEIAGSLRRRRETVGDLDILVTSRRPMPIMDTFTSMPEVEEIFAKGETKSSVRLKSGLQVDIRVIPEESFGAALHYFTGSKAHNVAIRDRAKRRGLKINEYGVFREKDDKRIGGEQEEDVFASVGLPWIPPELRENRGEIEAAEAGRLPKLIDLSDIRGDLQMHSKYSDGKNTIREMAEAGRALGYEYIAITDHSKAVAVAGGMDEQKLQEAIREIDRLNRELRGIRVLKSIEVDILADGSLDMDHDLLRQLDLVVASVHSRMNMPMDEMTERVLAALSTGLVTILAHPTGRLIPDRKPFEIDLDRILRYAAEHGIVVECNAFPDRLDLNDVHLKQAKELGVKVAIDTDSHNTFQLENMRFGVFTARRGWLEKKDVINTLPLSKLLAFLEKRRGEPAHVRT